VSVVRGSTMRSERDVLLRRLSVQRLLADPLSTAVDVVRLLTCVQSQEYAHAFWSLGMRSSGLGFSDVRREFDEGRFVRTHVLRPTWHFLAAEDLCWVLALTSPRVQQINASRYRQLDLDRRQLDQGSELITAALAGGRELTRPELGVALEAGGIPVDGQRLAYLVMNAELEALICSGRMRGAQHTYALVSERVVPTRPRSREEALGELAWRFFAGHGPASVKDLTRWSSLTTADARAGVELVTERLACVEVSGQQLWFDPDADPEPLDTRGSRALLVPLYDELTLSYPQLRFPVAAGHPHPPDTDLFVGSVLYDATNVGTWRRTVQGRKVVVETSLAGEVGSEGRTAVDAAATRMAHFIGS
jgi:hypothetical protein